MRVATLGGALASILWNAAVDASLSCSRRVSSRSVSGGVSVGVSELPTLAGFGSSSDAFGDTTHMLVAVGDTGFGYEGDVIALT